MKITNLNDEYLDKLPKFENRAKYLTRKYCNMWDIDKFDYYRDPNYNLALRIIKTNINKNVDLAFSYFCKLADKSRYTKYETFYTIFVKKPWYHSTSYILENNIIIKYDPIFRTCKGGKPTKSQLYYLKKNKKEALIKEKCLADNILLIHNKFFNEINRKNKKQVDNI